MNRWAVRMMGCLMILVFVLIFMQMYKTLKAMQRQQQPQSTTAPATGT